MKNPRLFSVLQQSAETDKQRALMTLELLSEHPAGIGDHSTEDFYKNAEEALEMLAAAEDRLETLERHFLDGDEGMRIVENGSTKSSTGS